MIYILLEPLRRGPRTIYVLLEPLRHVPHTTHLLLEHLRRGSRTIYILLEPQRRVIRTIYMIFEPLRRGPGTIYLLLQPLRRGPRLEVRFPPPRQQRRGISALSISAGMVARLADAPTNHRVVALAPASGRLSQQPRVTPEATSQRRRRCLRRGGDPTSSACAGPAAGAAAPPPPALGCSLPAHHSTVRSMEPGPTADSGVAIAGTRWPLTSTLIWSLSASDILTLPAPPSKRPCKEKT